jgi:hypothetical protein
MHRWKLAAIQPDFSISKESIGSTWGGVDNALAETSCDVVEGVEGRGDWLDFLSSISLAWTGLKAFLDRAHVRVR